MKKIFLVLALLFSSTAFACFTDFDCPYGSKCLKISGAMYGVCIGGIHQGTPYDQNSPYSTMYQKYGQTCYVDTDCKAGKRCVRTWGAYGTCM